MENTKVVTISGAEEVNIKENRGAAGSSPSLVHPEIKPARREVPLGTPVERLEILQQAASDYQKSGGRVTVMYRADKDALIIVLPETGMCADCGHWFSGNDGCPYCSQKISGKTVLPEISGNGLP